MAPIPSFYASCSAPYPFGARPQLRSSLDASDPFTEELFKEDTGFLSLKGLPGLRLSPSFQIKERRALRFGPFPTSLV